MPGGLLRMLPGDRRRSLFCLLLWRNTNVSKRVAQLRRGIKPFAGPFVTYGSGRGRARRRMIRSIDALGGAPSGRFQRVSCPSLRAFLCLPAARRHRQPASPSLDPPDGARHRRGTSAFGTPSASRFLRSCKWQDPASARHPGSRPRSGQAWPRPPASSQSSSAQLLNKRPVRPSRAMLIMQGQPCPIIRR